MIVGSNINVGQVFGIGDGTVTLYTRRVLQALMDLWEDVVKWPTLQDRAAMKSRLLEDAGDLGWGLFRDCIGIVDGTLIPIKYRPYQQERAAEFWNYRKAKYGLQVTIICDDRRRILMCDAQYPGAVHDARAFKALELSYNPREYFGRNQYLLGDSAYKITPRMIAPYKKPRNAVHSRDKKRFNRCLSR